MKKIFQSVMMLFVLACSMYAQAEENFYTACVRLDPEAITVMRWVQAYHPHLKSDSIKLDCGEAYAFLLDTTVLKLNYNSQLLSCPGSSCKLHSMNFIREFENLQIIELNGHRIENVEPAAALPELISLSLQDNVVKDLSPLTKGSAQQTLKVLNIRENLVDNLTPVQKLQALKALDVGFNRVTTLVDLSLLNMLTSLRIDFNPIQDLMPISNMTHLDTLEMSHLAKGVALDQLGETLTRLLFLDAHSNHLDHIDALSRAAVLQELNLTQNEIDDVRVLNLINKLKDAELGGNKLSFEQCLDMLQPRKDKQHICESINHWNKRF